MKTELNEKQIELIKEKHEKLRSIMIEYGNVEYGDCIIDRISELFDFEPTTVYYEE